MILYEFSKMGFGINNVKYVKYEMEVESMEVDNCMYLYLSIVYVFKKLLLIYKHKQNI